MAAHDEFDNSNPLINPPGSVDFDQLQDELDALLSSNERPTENNSLADELDPLTDSAVQDSSAFLTTADMRAFDLPADKLPDDHEPVASAGATSPDDLHDIEPEDMLAESTAANEAAGSGHNTTADATPNAATEAAEDSSSGARADADNLSYLDGEPESTAPAIAADSKAKQKIFLQESDLSGPALAENVGEWSPAADNHATDLDGVDPFSDDSTLTDQAPVHPDMSEDNVMQRRGSGRFVMLASVIGLAVAGAIYWLVGDAPEQAAQLASSQNQPVSNTADQQPGLSDVSAVNPQETATTPKPVQPDATTLQQQGSQPGAEKAVAAQQTETRKAAIQRAAVEKARRLAAKQAAEKRAAAAQAKARKLAAEKRTVVEKASAGKPAIIQPSTPLQKSPVKARVATVAALDEPGNWVIVLASVNSDKSARQHVARIRAMGVESEAVKVNDKGRIFHRIRVTGFSSKLEATKRRDVLIKQLGIRGTKIEKL